MRFGIHSNDTRDIGYRVAVDFAKMIIERDCVPVFEKGLENTVLASVNGVEFSGFDDVDVIVSIGGDGTFLSVISEYRHLYKPFVGINKGSIGFLTEISEYNIETALDRIVKGDYKLMDRIQLKAELYDRYGKLKNEDVCLNDVSVLRGAQPHITKLTLFINDERVEKFYGDGIVVAAPTGSTAYTLAAGGPLVMPNLDVILITPLCPHSLQNMSYVIPSDSVVEIQLGSFESVPLICPDGRSFVNIEQGDVLKIRKFDHPVHTINLGLTGFFQNVKRKIVARGSFYEDGKE